MRVITFELLCILFSFHSILFGEVSNLSFGKRMTLNSNLQSPVVVILFCWTKRQRRTVFRCCQHQVVDDTTVPECNLGCCCWASGGRFLNLTQKLRHNANPKSWEGNGRFYLRARDCPMRLPLRMPQAGGCVHDWRVKVITVFPWKKFLRKIWTVFFGRRLTRTIQGSTSSSIII